MADSQPAWPRLPNPVDRDGNARRVGVELEFQGPSLTEAAEALKAALGGSIKPMSAAELEIVDTGLGRLRLEVDFALLRALAQQAQSKDEPLLDWSVDVLSAASRLIVPLELVTEPLSLEQMGMLDDVVAELRRLRAKGTGDSAVFAFGVHLNVGVPAVTEDVLVSYVRAFACVFDWLVAAEDVDLTRRILPYVQRFPRDYEDLVLAPDYAPDWAVFRDDYLHYNPTRNRALDLLPVLAMRDADLIEERLGDALISRRPAFHYRLANCSLERPDWSVVDSWKRWLVVEALANDSDRLSDWCEQCLSDRDRMLSGWDGRWRERVERWLQAHPS